MSKSTHNFEFYRYQIIPVNRKQLDLFNQTELSIDSLLAKKNQYFIEAFENLCSSTYLDSIEGIKKFIFKKIYPTELFSNKQIYMFMMAKPKNITLETDEFTFKEIENWPRIHLIILNNEDEQIIAVERRTNVFPNTQNSINRLTEMLNKILEIHNLNVHIHPIYDKNDFWDFVKDKSIKKIEFNLVTPNMANISGAISEGLKSLAKSSNTARTDLILNAADQTSLCITRDNQEIASLVDYSSQGGGGIQVQFNGYKRAVNINKSTITTSIDNVIIQGNPDLIRDIILNELPNND
ncbi:hypothetical protein [Moraxella marmotae]|uniref:hypothetical protein n=1 Tax=Moraxella marmotae TaxID=3344520 RepID=UPI0035F2E524